MAVRALRGVSVPQDWLDIDFAIKEDIDFIAVSFVKSADVIKNLKSYLNARATKARACLLRRSSPTGWRACMGKI